jgi:hypothetical protein
VSLYPVVTKAGHVAHRNVPLAWRIFVSISALPAFLRCSLSGLQVLSPLLFSFSPRLCTIRVMHLTHDLVNKVIQMACHNYLG